METTITISLKNGKYHINDKLFADASETERGFLNMFFKQMKIKREFLKMISEQTGLD